MKYDNDTKKIENHNTQHGGEDAVHCAKIISSFGHDMRTPLNLIIGYTGTMLMQLPGPLNDDQKEQLDIVMKSANSLLSMIDTVMEFSMINSGTFVPNLEKIDTRKIADEIAIEYPSSKMHASVSFHIALPDEDTYVYCDMRLLKSILIKLINNSLQFTSDGKVELIFTQSRDHEGVISEISVKDTGVGIKNDEICNLFTFAAKTHIDKKRDDSLGIGLVLSRYLARTMNADIKCQSEYGKGSCFTIVFHDVNG